MSSSRLTPAEPTRWRRWLPPWWTALFPVAVLLGVAGWRAAAAADGTVPAFLAGLLWPGLPAAAGAAVMVWLGWVLDID